MCAAQSESSLKDACVVIATSPCQLQYYLKQKANLCMLGVFRSSHQWGCEDHVCTQNPYFPIFLFGRFFLLQNCCGSIQKRQLSPGNREIYQHLEHDSADPAPIMLTIWTQVGNQLRGTQHAFAPDTGQGKRHIWGGPPPP